MGGDCIKPRAWCFVDGTGVTMKSYLRGHQILYKNDEWVYADTLTPTVGNERMCGKCGRENTEEGHDPCLGTIKGAMNACCGHGTDKAYVQFESGMIIRGDIEL